MSVDAYPPGRITAKVNRIQLFSSYPRHPPIGCRFCASPRNGLRARQSPAPGLTARHGRRQSSRCDRLPQHFRPHSGPAWARHRNDFWSNASQPKEVTVSLGFLRKSIIGSGAVKFPRQRCFSLAAGAGALAAISLTVPFAAYDAQAQAARITKLVVPFQPGGSADTLSRLLADQIGRARGATLIVENRPGAGAMIGYDEVSRAVPDGKTLLVNAPSFVIHPHLRKVSYDPLTGFEPICYLVRSPLVIVVNGASPYRTLADLLTAARAKPGELSLASVGPATIQHLAFEMLKRSADVDITFIPYSGNPAAVNALLGGHVTAILSNYENVIDQLNAGNLHALATGSVTRIEELPQVPTVSESGYGDYEAENWFGLVAPAKTPKDVVSQFAEWAKAALLAPEVKTKLVDMALYPVGMCGADFAAHLRKQYENYGRLIREGNLKAQ
jgi:tripartite-type tricarboxylate transporter receptor subunit TctC